MAYDEYGEEIRRLFVPSEDPCSRLVPLQQLVVYDTSKQISQLQMKVLAKPDPFPNPSSMVVYIDGACRNNGTPTARASYGVYFGPNSPYNSYGLLPASRPQTSTLAEIEALSQALKIISEVTDRDFKLSEIKLATDSSFLVDSMSKWMEQWIENEGVGSRGTRVAHFEVLKQLHDKLDYMEYSDEGGGREVQFWHIPREMNREADALANRALDGA
ncbi:ribonuclease H-like protein [Cucurbitaria berberidis CBS 394.84]|uniref:ribonuclease H n=1 Tax=Cucurbitaria berberidis CBS 394.84 TaxID=1168544 RepID=A0A9P4G8M8_9PLEO|nr:ribonuclease H-like protein [Cucurbitaria berberidis CBS 394.84]KAF1841128.1 ribonuclease H-like protein [Cucurbitaria berberidis CBS 394.84]